MIAQLFETDNDLYFEGIVAETSFSTGHESVVDFDVKDGIEKFFLFLALFQQVNLERLIRVGLVVIKKNIWNLLGQVVIRNVLRIIWSGKCVLGTGLENEVRRPKFAGR